MVPNDPFNPENSNATVYHGTLTHTGEMEVSGDFIGHIACVLDADNVAIIEYTEVEETADTRGLIDLGEDFGGYDVMAVIPDDDPDFFKES